MRAPDRTPGVVLVTDRLYPIDRKRKAAFRLKKLGPAAYRRAVREGRLPRV